MIFTETKLKGAFILEVKKIEDERGFFGRSWCQKEAESYGLNTRIVQANVSFNKKKGTLRGMHYQATPYQENKIVRCTRGAIFDVIIDLRPDSATFKEWIGVELTEENYKMLYVPEGFAHGFITLQNNTELNYLLTEYYTPGAERGVRWDDPAFNIKWPIANEVISEKDQKHPDFNEQQHS